MILALDLSTKSTGWAVYDGHKLVDHGCISATSTILINRIQKITGELKIKVFDKYDISRVIAEEVQPTGGWGVGNQKTHKALMWMQAAVAFLIHDNYTGTTFDFIQSSSWRSACGIKTGRGVKREVLKERDIQFVKNTFGILVNDDEADAIGIGYSEVHKNDNEMNFV